MSNLSALAQPAGPTAAALRVYLLGLPMVVWDGRPLAVSRRQTRALLYRLAACLQPVPRDLLCFLFWPDIPEAIAHRHLTCLLTHLRLLLPAPGLLLTINDSVSLDPDHVWSDTADFAQLCANLTPFRAEEQRSEGAGERLWSRKNSPLLPCPSAPLPKRRGEALQQAVELYRGPFLHGFYLHACAEFEGWVTLERATWELLYLQALATLIDEHAARGAYDAAIAYARRYLATDDLAEHVYRRLIELYALTGNRGAALRQYEHCAAVLERELGISPLPETRAACQSVLEG